MNARQTFTERRPLADNRRKCSCDENGCSFHSFLHVRIDVYLSETVLPVGSSPRTRPSRLWGRMALRTTVCTGTPFGSVSHQYPPSAVILSLFISFPDMASIVNPFLPISSSSWYCDVRPIFLLHAQPSGSPFSLSGPKDSESRGL